MIKVAFVVPSEDKDTQRHVYWNELLGELRLWEVEAKVESISNFWGNSGKVNYKTWQEYNLIILTTDAANGSEECEGDKVLRYFHNEVARQELAKWVQNGGILFSEVQSQGGRPWQPSYDAIFGSGTLDVLPHSAIKRREGTQGMGYENVIAKEEERSSRGSVAVVSNEFHAHPLCYGLHPSVTNGYNYSGEQVILKHYREDRRTQFSLYYRCPEVIYSGWFVHWSPDWIPVLLESETAKWPVLLVKTDGAGAWAASTMRLTSRNALPLIRNLVFYHSFRESWLEYHKRILRARKRSNVIVISILVVLLLSMITIFGWNISSLRLLSIFSWLGAIAGVSILAIISGIIKWIRFFLRRPIGHPDSAITFWTLFKKRHTNK